MVGTEISHYRILTKLGEGGMGVVYKAQDTKLDRVLALKFLPERLRTSEQDKQRFIQEAKAASSLNHPNVCTIHDIQEHGSELFIVMECVEGVTLRKRLEDGPMSIHDAATYGIQIAEALQEAHSKSIVHRDIKSDNIMVNSKNQIKVMDFGLAKLKGTLKLTKTSSTIGTLAYMSPEQIQGGEVDSRSDIFSFGVLLFEMLTCHMPFRSAHEAAMVYSIVNEEPDSVGKYRSDVPGVLDNLIQRCLEKNPADRYQSAGEVVIELRRVLKQTSKVVTKVHHLPADVSMLAGPAGPPTATSAAEVRAAPPGAKKRSLLIGGSIAAAVLLAAAGYLLLFRTEKGASTALSFQSLKIMRLTSSGKALTAAISPDGKYVVYALEDAGKQSLWVRQVATNSNVQILPPDDVAYVGITLSGDGNYVYYVAATSAIYTLNRIPVLGGPAKKILTDLGPNITISPDGKKIAFTRVYNATGEFSLMTAGIDGTGERVLASHKTDLWFEGEPAWAPDGKTIACPLGSWAGGIHFELVAVGAEDGKEARLANTRWGAMTRVRWMPDGKSLLVEATEPNSTKSQLWMVDVSNGSATKLTNDLSTYADLSLTGDGKTLCVVQQDATRNVYLLPQGDAARATQITTGKENGDGVWTPDGRLVYTSTESGNPDIWICNADGTNKQQLTTDPNPDGLPAVAPDGKFIIFNSRRSGIPNIWRMDIDGSRQTQLTGGGEDYRADIAPDGKWFVFDSWDTGPNTIMKLSVDGGTPVQISESDGNDPKISPDGKRIAYTSIGKGEPAVVKLLIIPADGGKALRSFEQPSFARFGSIQWTRDGKGIAYVRRQKGVDNIWVQALDDSVPGQLTTFPSGYISSFRWSADGKNLAVSRATSTSDVLLMSAEK